MSVLHVHVFIAATEDIGEGLARVRALLDPEERARADRKIDPADRRVFEVAHGLLRVALSSVVAADPAGWRFRRDAQGKPHLDLPDGAPDLRFSLSHTRGLAACAITTGHDLGVDVETLDRRDLDDPALADLCFTALERADLEDLPAAQRHDARLELFTLKEAYVKARGLGLALDLASFCVARDGPALRRPPADDAQPWFLDQRRPFPRHVLGLAVRGVSEARVASTVIVF